MYFLLHLFKSGNQGHRLSAVYTTACNSPLAWASMFLIHELPHFARAPRVPQSWPGPQQDPAIPAERRARLEVPASAGPADCLQRQPLQEVASTGHQHRSTQQGCAQNCEWTWPRSVNRPQQCQLPPAPQLATQPKVSRGWACAQQDPAPRVRA